MQEVWVLYEDESQIQESILPYRHLGQGVGMPRYEQYAGESGAEAGKRIADNQVEDMIMDSLVGDESDDLFGGSQYSFSTNEEKTKYNQMAYNFLNGRYQARDKARFGSLDFESYINGLAPQEEFQTKLKGLAPSTQTESADSETQGALLWNQVFGESMKEMRSAAMAGGEV